ncbi:hypothetical protein B0F90DRAFT_1707922 [Multifurca ochricompacta]|uniref:Uncharacterized protein n=1 Tax=Multifurca ochricompacta TaxID=376703 RepID=A0AAD4M6Z2_9AGAM|nr:hypothetical protein B0F90DRAFT_1707922 [Multifurca ochricompacta]
MTPISSPQRERAENLDEDQQWEDMPGEEPVHHSRQPSSTSFTPYKTAASAARTRRTTKHRAVSTALLAHKHSYSDSRSPVRARRELGPIVELPIQQQPRTSGPKLREILVPFLMHIFCFITDVLNTVVRMLKIPISIALVIFACTYVLVLTSGAIRSALSPICSIPVVSLLCPAFHLSESPRASRSDRIPRWADFPGLLNVESKSLESLLDETVEGPGLALEIKKAEMATSDLRRCREFLADSLGEFAKSARMVGRGLTRFSSRVGGAVDNIIAVNDYALHAIEAANSKPSSFSLSRLLPFTPSNVATKQVVTRTFTEAMNTLSVNMQRLVLEAQMSVSDLDKLEAHLNSIHEIVAREDSSISTARAELLAQLWTILGGNRGTLKGMNEHLALLKGVSGYRDRALAHVVAALQMLQTMSEDMEDLRERVAAPELVGNAIPIEVHMKSLRSGLERLKGQRTGARKKEEQIVNQILGFVKAKAERE